MKNVRIVILKKIVLIVLGKLVVVVVGITFIKDNHYVITNLQQLTITS
ncbi:MAG: hypothetical protein IH841_05175 [Thaumarchaeota archaeon]|nr:hypothetical protein [Nitrososphaerota archaeon]